MIAPLADIGFSMYVGWTYANVFVAPTINWSIIAKIFMMWVVVSFIAYYIDLLLTTKSSSTSFILQMAAGGALGGTLIQMIIIMVGMRLLHNYGGVRSFSNKPTALFAFIGASAVGSFVVSFIVGFIWGFSKAIDLED